MALRATRWLPLDFRSLTTGQDEVRWALDGQEQPSGKQWCWATSLVNVLVAYGRATDQAKLVRCFRKKHEYVGDEGASLPREAWETFYRDHFPEAKLGERPRTIRELEASLYRSPSIGVLDSLEGAHLVAIGGLRRLEGRWEVWISDSLRRGARWVPWDDLVDAGQSNAWGPWTESIFLGKPGFSEYAFRFIGKIDQLGKQPPPKDAQSKAPEAPSRLERDGTPQDPKRLAEELSLSLLGYTLWRSETHDVAALRERIYLHESLRLFAWHREPDGARRPFAEEALVDIGWHHQLHDGHDGPQQYAQTRRIDDDWRTRWVGERWLTRNLARAIRWADENLADVADRVRLVWIDFGLRGHVHLLWLLDARRFLVASASRPGLRRVWQPGDELRLLTAEEVDELARRTEGEATATPQRGPRPPVRRPSPRS